MVHPFDHQQAAEFWGIDDPRLALQVNAIVGGTPAYRKEFVRGDTPANIDDFDPWVLRTVLNPASPLFREARYLLADELDIHDTALYHSVLAAIAEGNATRSGIAGFLGRKSGDLAHPLTVLEDSGLITREPDVFRANRTTYHIAEPLITFYHAVMRPIWADLEYGRNTARLWERNRHRFTCNVLGRHLEHVCRFWARYMAPFDLFGAQPNRVGSGNVNDPAKRARHEIDVVVFGGLDGDQAGHLLAIGEAEWGEVMGAAHLARLRHLRGLLVAQNRPGAATARLACFSAAGFTDDLRAEAARATDVLLVGEQELYAPTDASG